MRNNFAALFSFLYYDGIKLYPPFSSGISLINCFTRTLLTAMAVPNFFNQYEKDPAEFSTFGHRSCRVQFLCRYKKRLPGK